MDKRVKDERLEFTIGKTNLEVSIYEHDIGINVLSIHAEHIDKYSDKNNYETLLEDIRTFTNTKLSSILASNNIDIVGVRSKTTSYNWCSLSFYVDHLDNINAFKVLFKFGSEFSSVTVLEYQSAIDSLNSIVARMLSRGYELAIQDSNDLLNTGYNDLCEEYKEEAENEK